MDTTYGIVRVKRLCTINDPGELCTTPYPGHPRGCPNYGREGCPPHTPDIRVVMDTTRPMYLCYAKFDLLRHERLMSLRHPRWSSRQCRNLLYWQGHVRRCLREHTSRVMWEKKGEMVLYCPEAYGVNVFKTMEEAGIRMDPTHSLHYVHLVSMVGTPE